MTQERPYVPSEDFGTVDHDDFQLDWLEEARSNSDLYLLSGWARLRVETLRAERDAAIARAEAAEALAASRPEITPAMADYFLNAYANGCVATWAALRAHAAKVSR